MKSVRQSLGALCAVLFTLPVAAFVFSAISPDDDDVQQDRDGAIRRLATDPLVTE
jgi:hypothetical protein